MWSTKNVRCPVCGAILGKVVPDQASSYPCKECQWIFPFDADGKNLPPTKLNPKKPQTCGCEGCKYRDEQDLLKKIRKL